MITNSAGRKILDKFRGFLLRTANDFTTFPAAVPVSDDVFIFEDKSDGHKKKKGNITQISSGSFADIWAANTLMNC